MEGRYILDGTCMIHPKVGDTIGYQKYLHNNTKDECHAKAAVEFKRCSNGDETPITATYEYKNGTSSSISFPKRKGSRTWIQTKLYQLIFKEISYYGVQYYHECWCGNAAPQEDQQANELKCDAPCVGTKKDTKIFMCGGNWFINIRKVCWDQDCKFSYE